MSIFGVGKVSRTPRAVIFWTSVREDYDQGLFLEFRSHPALEEDSRKDKKLSREGDTHPLS